jgi:hypothetical protein
MGALVGGGLTGALVGGLTGASVGGLMLDASSYPALGSVSA